MMSTCARVMPHQGRQCASFSIQYIRTIQSNRHFHSSLSGRASARAHAKQNLVKQRFLEREKLKAEEMARKKEMKEKGIKQAPPKREIVRTSMIQAKDTTFFNENAVDRWSVSLKLDYLLQAEQFSGETYRFDEQVCDQLQALGMFNAKQPFHYMRWPTTAVRTNSGLIARQLFDERIKHLGTNDRRVVVTGKAGSGKSIALLQICAAALSEGYVVVAVPRGMDLVENRTAFHLEECAKRYHQDQYLSNMITRTRKACRKTLAKETTRTRVRIQNQIFAEGTPLTELLEEAESYPDKSMDIFIAFLLQMSLPDRPPMLFLFDNINAISAPTQIPDPKPPHNPLHPHKLWIPFFFICLMNGTLSQPNAAFIAATSAHPACRTLDIALGNTKQKPYEPIDRRIPHTVEGATVLRIGDKLTQEEAIGLSFFWQRTGLLKTVDRFDGLTKSVGDEQYRFAQSPFFTGYSHKANHSWARTGRLNPSHVKQYLKTATSIPKDDATDIEAVMTRLALGGYTIGGFWKACSRMANY